METSEMTEVLVEVRLQLHEDLRLRFNDALVALEHAAWMRGWDLGGSIERRVAEEAVTAAALRVLGKDRGDGIIDLGALGRWYPQASECTPTREADLP